MYNRIAFAGLALAASLLSAPVFAQAHDHAHMSGMDMSQSAALVTAEVRAVDLKGGRIILKHDAHAGMSAMTMAFALAKGLTLPAGLKPGDTVKVRIEDLAGTQTITQIQR